MTTPLALVTIAVPTFDRLDCLVEAVESALAQTWANIEVLVGDDGSGTATEQWCRTRAGRDPRLRYHRNPRALGFAGNLNALVSRAAGEFVVLLGDDDRMLPQCVETLVTAAGDEAALAFCNHHVIDEHGLRLDDETARVTRDYRRAGLPAGPVEDARLVAWQMAILPSAALVRRRYLETLRLDEDLDSPDIEFFIRLANTCSRFVFVPEPLVEFRVHRRTITARGLRNERLVTRLLAIPAPAHVEHAKRALLAHLLVNAVSRLLQQGEWRAARQFLESDYYPRASRRGSYLVQHACATLPPSIGQPMYRLMMTLKHASAG